MSERLSTAEASQETGIPEPTIKNWIGRLPIPAEKDSAGRWRFGPEALDVLRAIKELRDEDRTFETIRRRIGEPEMSAELSSANPGSSEDNPRLHHDEPAVSLDERRLADELAGAITPQLVEALKANNDLAEKYARAAHQIGQMEERVANLTTQLNADRDRHVQELEAARAEIAQLKAPALRPWWKLWG